MVKVQGQETDRSRSIEGCLLFSKLRRVNTITLKQ